MYVYKYFLSVHACLLACAFFMSAYVSVYCAVYCAIVSMQMCGTHQLEIHIKIQLRWLWFWRSSFGNLRLLIVGVCSVTVGQFCTWAFLLLYVHSVLVCVYFYVHLTTPKHIPDHHQETHTYKPEQTKQPQWPHTIRCSPWSINWRQCRQNCSCVKR